MRVSIKNDNVNIKENVIIKEGTSEEILKSPLSRVLFRHFEKWRPELLEKMSGKEVMILSLGARSLRDYRLKSV